MAPKKKGESAIDRGPTVKVNMEDSTSPPLKAMGHLTSTVVRHSGPYDGGQPDESERPRRLKPAARYT